MAELTTYREDWSDDEEEFIVLTAEELALSDELDRDIKRERVMAGVELTTYIHNRVDKESYKRAKRRMYYENFCKRHPEKVKQMASKSYQKHKGRRLQKMKEYYNENKDEILDQKKSYYLRHREEILEKRKKEYQPHPSDKPLKEGYQAEMKRRRERSRYQQNKDEINRRRRERRRLLKEGGTI